MANIPDIKVKIVYDSMPELITVGCVKSFV